MPCIFKVPKSPGELLGGLGETLYPRFTFFTCKMVPPTLTRGEKREEVTLSVLGG